MIKNELCGRVVDTIYQIIGYSYTIALSGLFELYRLQEAGI